MPGYMFHLSEGQRILEKLEQEHGFYLPAGWKNHFLLGCLLPDTERGMDKQRTHFWDPQKLMNLKRRPEPKVFFEQYRDYMEDPRVLGYLAHLDLDEVYMNQIWDRRMTFLNAEGQKEEIQTRITHVQLDGVEEPVPIEEFLSDQWLYGDYTRINTRLMEDYQIELPVFTPVDWEDCPIRQTDAMKLAQVLKELQDILEMKMTSDETQPRFLRYEWVRELLDHTAENCAERIADLLKSIPQAGDIDLHAHTICSDGSLTPTQLVQLAMRRRLKALAITDHDTQAGVPEAMEAGARLGVRIIPGMEFSTKEEGHSVHMVALFLDPENESLKRALNAIVQERWNRNQRMAQKLIDAGMGVTWDHIRSLGDGVWTRGNLGRLMVEVGAVASVNEAFERYLGHGCPFYVDRKHISPADAVRITHEAGGLIFVAHYYQIDKSSLANSYRIAENILRGGADGLETLYSVYDDKMREETEELAQRYHCLRSGGSDFHGAIKPGLELGYGYGHLSIPEWFLQEMDAKREQ